MLAKTLLKYQLTGGRSAFDIRLHAKLQVIMSITVRYSRLVVTHTSSAILENMISRLRVTGRGSDNGILV